MSKSFYKYISEAWKRPEIGTLQEWRRQPSAIEINRPTRLDRARALGYKAKEGIHVVRSRIRRGSRRKPRPKGGRRSKRMSAHKTSAKSIQRIAEERANRKYPDMEVLNSYWVGADGRYKWYEVILVERNHPAIRSDPELNWICEDKGRVFRGRTSASAGRRSRGLRKS